MNKILFTMIAALSLTSCDDMKPNNTARNADIKNEAMTAEEQLDNDEDRAITQDIRQALMEDEALSMNAKNIKVITVDGVVTLKGPVNSEEEKSKVEEKAKGVSGVDDIDSQIEVIEASN